MRKNLTLRERIFICFVILGVLPLILNVALTYYNDRKQILENRDQIATMDVQQVTRELETELSGYENVLYQLYTDENLANLVTQLEQGENTAVIRNQIRRRLRSVFWLQKHIVSLTIITNSGEMAFYDRLSFSGQTNVSLVALSADPSAIFTEVASQTQTTYFPTQYATYFNGNMYDLFYMGHRMIGEQINQSDAVILMAVDAKLLQDSLTTNWLGKEHEKYMFLLDENRQIIWHPNRTYLGQQLSMEEDGIINFVAETNELEGNNLIIFRRECQTTGWTMVSVLDCASFTKAIDQRLVVTVAITLLSFCIVTIIMLIITSRMMQSVNNVCKTMQNVSRGDLSVRAECPANMTPEIQVIATGLNSMADRLENLMRIQRESVEKIKNAEIAALEAQLNPHFLYNTLDTLNWMAIDEDQYAISNVISALAKTLRYGIDYSNSIVTIEDEVEWLKQYLFIHQNRLKSHFSCVMNIPPEVLHCRVHKLLIQPFVENAMLHGFQNDQEFCSLNVTMKLNNEMLTIIICDNGCGIPNEILNSLSVSEQQIDCGKRYRGMQNAINRILLYYGEQAKIEVSSSTGGGTCITLSIPANVEEGEKDANRNCGG